MKKIVIKNLSWTWVIACLAFITGCQKNAENSPGAISSRSTIGEASSSKDPKSLKDFVQVNLVGKPC